MNVLALDSALDWCAAGLFAGDIPVRITSERLDRGHAARLPAMVATLLDGAPAVELIAVTVGPGSFTGLRAGLSLAQGLAAAWGCALVGVTVVEALARGAATAGAPVWVALRSRAGRIFLGRDGAIDSLSLDDLPAAPLGTVVTGNEAAAVVARLAQRGQRATLHAAVAPALADIAAIGRARHLGVLPPCPALPLYVDAPLAKPP